MLALSDAVAVAAVTGAFGVIAAVVTVGGAILVARMTKAAAASASSAKADRVAVATDLDICRRSLSWTIDQLAKVAEVTGVTLDPAPSEVLAHAAAHGVDLEEVPRERRRARRGR